MFKRNSTKFEKDPVFFAENFAATSGDPSVVEATRILFCGFLGFFNDFRIVQCAFVFSGLKERKISVLNDSQALDETFFILKIK